jgi:hypothetical protein
VRPWGKNRRDFNRGPPPRLADCVHAALMPRLRHSQVDGNRQTCYHGQDDRETNESRTLRVTAGSCFRPRHAGRSAGGWQGTCLADARRDSYDATACRAPDQRIRKRLVKIEDLAARALGIDHAHLSLSPKSQAPARIERDGGAANPVRPKNNLTCRAWTSGC